MFVCLFVCVIPLKLVSGHSDHTVSRVADVGRSRCLTNKRVGPGERKPKGACSRLNQRHIVTRKKNWQAVEQGQKPDRATQREKADEPRRRRTGKKTQRKQKGQERKQQQKTEKRKRNQKRRAQREQVRRPSKHVFHVRRRMVFMFDVDHFGARIGIQIMLGSSKRRRRKTEKVNQFK